MQHEERKESVRRPSGRASVRVRGAVIVALVAALLTSLVAPAGARTVRDTEDVLGQGGVGVHAEGGATLQRQGRGVRVNWKIPTPLPSTYEYPSPDMIPPGAPPHPPIEPGVPEVFTLWAFVFNFPELCDGPCDFPDIGDTPAQGGIYQLDSTIATCFEIKMSGWVKKGLAPLLGAPLQNPMGAEVHVAMAPHGKKRSGAELARQRSGSVGTPAFWWPAIFEPA